MRLDKSKIINHKKHQDHKALFNRCFKNYIFILCNLCLPGADRYPLCFKKDFLDSPIKEIGLEKLISINVFLISFLKTGKGLHIFDPVYI